MDFWFRKLYGRQEPAGIELELLRRMPLVLLCGTVLALVVAFATRQLVSGPTASEAAKFIASVDIFLIAAVITFWTAVVTVSIACFIIFVMKGPAYVADAYPLEDARRPALTPRAEGRQRSQRAG
jgi:hypothetical protein